MLKLRLFFIATCFFNLAVHAQQVVPVRALNCFVADSAAKTSIPFASIYIKGPSGKVKTAVSSEHGEFKVEGLNVGVYTMIVSSIGYQTKTLKLVLDSIPSKIFSIMLSKNTRTLKGVTITGYKPLIRRTVDRLIYDVQTDPENPSLTLFDILRKTPLLSVDGDENIKLKGSSNFKVLINGKISTLSVRNVKEIYLSLPASSIQRVEVITTPPSKYDAEGFSGILNIVMLKNTFQGYTNTISARYSFPYGPGLSESFTSKLGKISVQAQVNKTVRNTPETRFTNLREQVNPVSTFSQNGTNTSDNNLNNLTTEISYEPDSLKLLTATIGYNRNVFKSNNNQKAELLNAQSNPVQSYQLLNTGKNTWDGLDIGLDYQIAAKHNKELLYTTSYRFSSYENLEGNEVSILDRVAYPQPNYRSANEAGTKEHTVQFDYINPLKHVTIEAGGKAIFRANYSRYAYENLNSLNNQYESDRTQDNSFDYQQNIYALYNSYAIKWSAFDLKAGVRLEHTYTDAAFRSTNTALLKHYTNLVPSVSFQYHIGNNQSLNAGFSQRIQRPNIEELNPFISNLDPKISSTGNPNLAVVVANNLEASYTSSKKATLNIGLYYTFINNNIEYISIYNPSTDVTTFTNDNIGKNRKAGLNFSYGYPVSKKVSINMNGEASYTRIKGFLNAALLENDGFQGYGSLNASYSMGKGWRSSGNLNYNGPWIILQGKSNAAYYYSVSLSKAFLKNKARVSGSINNPFEQYRYYKNQYILSGSTQTNSYQNYYRTFSFSFSYKFGKMKGSVRSKERGISNDDIKPSKNS
jgi:outer membrane receptor protein involved in Fe transport